MKLLLCRHGQTLWNTQHRTQGHTDIFLDETGIRQAQCFAQRLAQEPIDCIYCSPLSRARQTAAAVAATTGAPVVADERIIERNFGAFEGLSLQEIDQIYPESLKVWDQRPYEHMIEGAEPMPELEQRCRSFLDDVLRAYPDGQVLVVSHSIPLRMMLVLLTGMPKNNLHAFYLSNCTYTKVLCGPKRNALLVMNDSSHLRDKL